MFTCSLHSTVGGKIYIRINNKILSECEHLLQVFLGG